MVRFIKQEAEEKANEIGVSAEEVRYPSLRLVDATHALGSERIASLFLQEFNIEKLQLIENEKGKIKKDYERREGQIEVKKKM